MTCDDVRWSARRSSSPMSVVASPLQGNAPLNKLVSLLPFPADDNALTEYSCVVAVAEAARRVHRTRNGAANAA
jgi:hypothetical protein